MSVCIFFTGLRIVENVGSHLYTKTWHKSDGGAPEKQRKRLCKMKARSNQLAEFIEDRDVSQYFSQQGTTCAEPDGYFRTY